MIRLITDYRIVEGLPKVVESKVIHLLSEGWCLNGEMYHIKSPCEKADIVVQSLVKIIKEEEKINALY